MLKRLIPDRFVMVLFATLVLASVLPVQGAAVPVANAVSQAAIFALFYLHGLRLPRAEVVMAARNWRLQALIALFVFAAMPLAGLALAPLAGLWLPAGLATGLVFLTVLPTTVQSSISYASIGGGNVAASVMASAVLNLMGIVVTPLLLVLVLGAQGEGALGWGVAGKIMLILLLPFCLGQLSQRWLGGWARRQKALLSIMDKAAIAIAVYVAFSSAVANGLWQTVDLGALARLAALLLVLLGFAFAGSWMLGGAAALARGDRISLVFAGAHKSIATGAPMAAILFHGPEAGMVILPALLYHQAQLIVSAPLANRLAAAAASRRA